MQEGSTTVGESWKVDALAELAKELELPPAWQRKRMRQRFYFHTHTHKHAERRNAASSSEEGAIVGPVALSLLLRFNGERMQPPRRAP